MTWAPESVCPVLNSMRPTARAFLKKLVRISTANEMKIAVDALVLP